MTTLIACMSPQIQVSGKGMLDTLVRRTVRLTGDEAAVFAAVSNMIDTAGIKRDDIVATSFDVALGKYNQSRNTGRPYEHLVDLATASEGVLIGAENEGEGLTLRLRTRAAALLARDDDPATVVFGDVKKLYGLRSKLVHVGQITEKDLRKVFTRVSTGAPTTLNADVTWPSLTPSIARATWFGAPSSPMTSNETRGEPTGTPASPRPEPATPMANPVRSSTTFRRRTDRRRQARVPRADDARDSTRY